MTGSEAGSLRMFNLGVEFRGRYSGLWNFTSRSICLGNKDRRMRVWSSDSLRVIDSAKYFAMGFYGVDEFNDIEFEIVPETRERWANSLTPSYYPFRNETYISDTRVRDSVMESIPH